MSQKIESKIRKSTKVHPGYTLTKKASGEESDLSGQLSHVNITHHHAGANAPEKTIKASRDSNPAMDAALPPTGE